MLNTKLANEMAKKLPEEEEEDEEEEEGEDDKEKRKKKKSSIIYPKRKCIHARESCTMALHRASIVQFCNGCCADWPSGLPPCYCFSMPSFECVRFVSLLL